MSRIQAWNTFDCLKPSGMNILKFWRELTPLNPAQQWGPFWKNLLLLKYLLRAFCFHFLLVRSWLESLSFLLTLIRFTKMVERNGSTKQTVDKYFKIIRCILIASFEAENSGGFEHHVASNLNKSARTAGQRHKEFFTWMTHRNRIVTVYLYSFMWPDSWTCWFTNLLCVLLLTVDFYIRLQSEFVFWLMTNSACMHTDILKKLIDIYSFFSPYLRLL